MAFLTPWLLYGLAALVAPIAIHLWQRRRVIQVPFPTLRFLKKAGARTSRSAKLENLLLLLLRCLVVALIAAAAARPVVSTESSRLFGGSVPKATALVIDNSLSMSYKAGDKSRLEVVKQEANTVLNSLKPGDEVVVISVNNQAHMLVGELTIDHAAARRAVDSIQPTEEGTDFGAALRDALKAISKEARTAKQIFLFTDNQDAAWQFEKSAVFDATWKQMNPALVIVRPDGLDAVNAAITKVRFDTPYASSGAVVKGVAYVENHSSAAFHDLLDLRIGADRIAQRSVDAEPESNLEIPFEFQMPVVSGRWAQGSANLSGDNLAADDTYAFTLPVLQPPRALVVEQGEGPERARTGFFLRKALSAGASGTPIRTITPAELDDQSVDAYSAVFLAGVASISDRAAVRLDRYLQSGGTVVVFPSDQTDLAAMSRVEWLPAKLVKFHELPAARLPANVLEPGHPLFANSWDANTPFPALPQRKVLDLEMNKGGRTLLTIGENIPFIVYADRGSGRVIFVNAAPDRAWGDFPLTPAFLPLVQQIGRLSISRTGKEASFSVGDPIPAPLSLARTEPLSLKLPNGETSPISGNGPLLERAELAGSYSVISPSDEEAYRFSVNPDPHESRLAPITEETLTSISPHELVGSPDALRIWLNQSRGMKPLWPLLLVLALLAYASEAIYSNLLASHRSQGGAEGQIQTGRLNKRRLGQPYRDTQAGGEPETHAAAETAPSISESA